MILQVGSISELVKRLQEFLNISADGVFGGATQRAVKKWQEENGLIADGVFVSYGEWEASNSLPKEPSYYLWYKTKRPGECEIINDRRVWTLMGNRSTQDWVYDSNSIFTWGRAYRGITLNHYTLVDENGNYAPSDLCKFLFIDNGHGKIINPDGICQVGDFYHNWGFSFE